MAATFPVELLVLILGLGSGVFTQSICKDAKVNPCSCTLENGTIINIEPDGLKTGPKFSFHFDNVSISYNPCNPFNGPSGCKNVAGCYNETSSLGSQDSAKWTGTTGNNIAISYKTDNMTLSVLLKCNRTLVNPSFTVQFVQATENNETEVSATLESKWACAELPTPPTTPSPDPPSPKKKGISTGTLLLILFMVFLVVYLAGGILYKKFVKGAQGKELIPNVEFWMALPGLICDGVAFTCNCFGKRKSNNQNYDNI